MFKRWAKKSYEEQARTVFADLCFRYPDQACWVKAWVDGKDWPEMVALNENFYKFFGERHRGYEGKSDEEQWPEDMAPVYRISDHLAILVAPKDYIDIEQTVDSEGDRIFVKIKKNAQRIKGAFLVYGTCEVLGHAAS